MPEPHPQLDVEENVRTRAYLLWEMGGRQQVDADLYWHRARDLIKAESCSAYPPVQSLGHRR